MNKVSVAVAIFLLSNISFAGVTTMGDRPCSKWNEGRKSPDAPYALAQESWLAGFLSGYAVGTGSDFLATASGPELVQSITRFCAANPTKGISDGAKELASTMNRKK